MTTTTTTAKPALSELLDSWSVMETETAPLSGGFMVVNDDETVAVFRHEADALRFRLAEINRILNG